MQHYDAVIIGGGIVGLATALSLRARGRQRSIAVLEKEPAVGGHQTGHNSGVIHAGIYYKPGSLKARLCVDGAARMVRFCEEHGVPYQLCGKLIIATDKMEIAGLHELHRRGTANGAHGLRLMSAAELREVEPHAAGVAGLHSPRTGIVDYGQVARTMAELLQQQGVEILTRQRVRAIHRDGADLRLQTDRGEIRTRGLINCAGLYSDKVARMMGLDPGVQIVPFRGEYYMLKPERRHLLNGLIYPVPDPQFPFLGVHLTRTIHGEAEAGPNAVLAFAREGYTRMKIRPGELWESIAFSGFRTLAARYWRMGLLEYYRSFSKAAFTRSLQRLMPALIEDDLEPGGAGVRAQAVSAQGSLVDDFHVVSTGGAVHVLNAPSPAATASLAIGEYIAQLAEGALDLKQG